ncbi:hypothetical protein IL306_002171 [Fusarium sp. DS 682]|nr:hypothetical protein IL306_002171 [Fusarium sp. DS 682]
MLRGALWDQDGDICDADPKTRLVDEITFYMNQLKSLQCGYALAEDYSWHLEQNMDCLEDITAKVKALISEAKSDHEVESVLNLDGWTSLEDFEVSNDAFEVWSPPDDWIVELDLEEDSDESA